MYKIPLDEYVQGAFVILTERFPDNRGSFEEIYSSARYDFMPPIQQTNLSRSQKNVVRGLHVAKSFGKLCTCVRGCLFDVVVDVRPDSPTFKKSYGAFLDDVNRHQLYVPPGCAHGFFAVEDNTVLVYQQTGLYNPDDDVAINWLDPDLKVWWPESEEYILSSKDESAPYLRDILR